MTSFRKIAAIIAVTVVLSACQSIEKNGEPGENPSDYSDFLWELDEDGQSVTITGYTGEETVIAIPGMINGVSVRHIGYRAFFLSRITSVSIPDSVTHIGDSAFNSNRLTSVNIPEGVTHIGDSAFFENRLTSVSMPDSLTHIGHGAFDGNQLTSVSIPGSVTHIGIAAFTDNQLTSVSIPGSVTHIDAAAFSGNPLTSVSVPDSVTHIGDFAFDDNRLTKVTIGANLPICSSFRPFSEGFADAYITNNKAAGTYTRPNTGSDIWTKQN